MLAALAVVAGARAVETDCAGCHGASDRPAGAADYTRFWREAVRHHATGVVFPDVTDPRYVQPDGEGEDFPYFDRNHDGILEADELRLSPLGTVECSSCHIEHDSGAGGSASDGAYLRGTVQDSAQCRECHRL